MNQFVKLGALLCLGSAFCLAESWTGKLVDSSCMDRQGNTTPSEREQPNQLKMASACAPTRSTTTFGIELQDGRVLRLDSTGNAKAAEALRGNTASSSNTQSGAINVTVTGTLEGRTVKVESIELQ